MHKGNFVTNMKAHETMTIFWVVVFYAVGIAGMSFSFSSPLFLKLIPFALLLSISILAIYHQERYGFKTISVFVSIFLLGLIVEMAGVNTGEIFGAYRYGNSLGLKILNTPIMIGVNWLLLIYTTSSLFDKFSLHPLLKVLLASGVMLLYDLVLEHAAPKMDMWFWQNNRVPLQNYLAWFFIAVGFHLLLKLFKVKTANPMSYVILICQFLFFIILSITLK